MAGPTDQKLSGGQFQGGARFWVANSAIWEWRYHDSDLYYFK